MAKLTLSVAVWDYDRTRPLIDGTVRIDGVEPTIMTLTPEEIFFRAFRDAPFDVCELSLSSFTLKTALGDCSYVGVPAFLSRAFRHTSIYVRKDRIKRPLDLKGRRIGVNVLNNIGTLLISSVLQEHGMSVRDVHFVPVPFTALGLALKRHAVDVAWLPEPTASADEQSMGLQELVDLDQGATEGFPVGWYVVTKAWAKKYPRTLAAFLAALRAGQQIADGSRTAVEQAMEKLPAPFTVSPAIAAVMSIETYPLTIAPDINRVRIQRVADEMLQFHMLTQPFKVNTMLGGP